MSSINIPVEIAEPRTGMAHAVLQELIEHLDQLASRGETHVIDLTSLPMTESDKQELADLLGKGEVDITLNTIGESRIFETRFNGIWWLKHYTPDQQLISELIEVTAIPEIIVSHVDDIRLAAQQIKKIDVSDETGDKV